LFDHQEKAAHGKETLKSVEREKPQRGKLIHAKMVSSDIETEKQTLGLKKCEVKHPVVTSFQLASQREEKGAA